jgi:hypothetical protein
MNNPIYIWFVCLSIILAFIYVGIIYWKRYDVAGLDNLTWSRFVLYTGTPAIILTIGMTLYSMYRPMKHYPPLYILILYALLGSLYGMTIGYLGYNRFFSIPSCIVMSSIFVAVVLGIFVYTPATYDTHIDEAEDKFVKNQQYPPDELDKLRKELMKTFSEKNKYYIQWFIVLLYVPIIVHYAYRCVLNPIAYQYIYDYILNLFNLKGQKMEPSFIKQSNDILETLDHLDKNIKYTETEKKLIDKIRTAVAEKKQSELKFTEEDYSVLRKIRRHLEKNSFLYHNKTSITSLYQAITKLIEGNKISIQENGLYLINLVIIISIMIYVFIYAHPTKFLIIPLISIVLSLSIFYLNG